MLLAIDVGNTNTVFGVYKGNILIHKWRIRTIKDITVDEFNLSITNLFFSNNIKKNYISRTIISCVVPLMSPTLESFCNIYLDHHPHWVNFKSYKSMSFLVNNPKNLGSDRIANSVAAYSKYLKSLIIIDFGTATTFDSISKKGEFLGGAISPGIIVSSDALFREASKLHRVSIAKTPKYAIGQDTSKSIRSGIIFGYAGLVDGIVKRISQEMGGNPLVISTGGLASLMFNISKTIKKIEPLLTLEGLQKIDASI